MHVACVFIRMVASMSVRWSILLFPTIHVSTLSVCVNSYFMLFSILTAVEAWLVVPYTHWFCLLLIVSVYSCVAFLCFVFCLLGNEQPFMCIVINIVTSCYHLICLHTTHQHPSTCHPKFSCFYRCPSHALLAVTISSISPYYNHTVIAWAYH